MESPSERPFRLWSRPVISWAMYDFANTIFSFAVITRYFNEWVLQDHNAPDWWVSLMGLCVAAALIVTMPPLGAIADRSGRRIPFLLTFTLTCGVATIAMGLAGNLLVALVLCGIAQFAYQSAIAHYDPLLATVAPPERQGAVSGFGVGLGYVGSLVAVVVLTAIVGEGDKQHAFIPTALMYLVFSIPIFLFVKERRLPRTDETSTTTTTAQVIRQASRQLVDTSSHMWSDHRSVARFLIGRFFYADALLTVILYMTVYMDRLDAFTESQKTLLLALSIITAAVGAFIAGAIVERKGPRIVLLVILGIFATTVALAGLTASPTLVWALGPLVGLGLGAVWTSDRVFMMRLTPEPVRGEFFGIYNLIGKLSSGVGPFVIWGGCLWLLHEQAGWSKLDASRVALGGLAAAAVLGLLIVRPLSDKVTTATGQPELDAA